MTDVNMNVGMSLTSERLLKENLDQLVAQGRAVDTVVVAAQVVRSCKPSSLLQRTVLNETANYLDPYKDTSAFCWNTTVGFLHTNSRKHSLCSRVIFPSSIISTPWTTIFEPSRLNNTFLRPMLCYIWFKIIFNCILSIMFNLCTKNNVNHHFAFVNMFWPVAANVNNMAPGIFGMK